MTDNYVYRLILKAFKRWYKSIEFTWWEPLLAKNIIFYIKFASKVWFKQILIKTNWYLFSNFAFVKECYNAGMTGCHISIHNCIANKHDYIVGKEWAFYKTIDAIKNLHLLWVHIGLQIVLNKSNYKDIKSIVLFFVWKWIVDFVILFQEIEWEVLNNKNKLLISYSDVIPYLIDLLLLFTNLNWNYIKILNIPYCLFPIELHKYLISVINLTINSENKEHIYMKEKKYKNKQLNCCNWCVFYDKCNLVEDNYLKYIWSDEFIFIKPLKYNNISNKINYNIIDIYMINFIWNKSFSSFKKLVEYIKYNINYDTFFIYSLITWEKSLSLSDFKKLNLLDINNSIYKIYKYK